MQCRQFSGIKVRGVMQYLSTFKILLIFRKVIETKFIQIVSEHSSTEIIRMTHGAPYFPITYKSQKQ